MVFCHVSSGKGRPLNKQQPNALDSAFYAPTAPPAQPFPAGFSWIKIFAAVINPPPTSNVHVASSLG